MSIVKTKDLIQGTVLEIQRMSTEDGPGIRTTVFMKGCPLSCRWCHNPESISPLPEIHWMGVRCIGCGTCVKICPEKALSISDAGISINRTFCTGCGICAESCPSTALEQLGMKWSVDSLFEEIIKDRAYFEKSSGGVTISGGEGTLQIKFVSGLLKKLKAEGIHTAVDTCGMFNGLVFDEIFPHADLILYDLKEIDSDLHKKFTGCRNEMILDNLKRSAEYIKEHIYPREIWVRTPVIPGATARRENIEGIGKLIASLPHGVVKRWDLCAFNNLCKDKYIRLDKQWEFEKTPLIEESFMNELTDIARKSGVDPEIVMWSGSTVSPPNPPEGGFQTHHKLKKQEE